MEERKEPDPGTSYDGSGPTGTDRNITDWQTDEEVFTATIYRKDYRIGLEGRTPLEAASLAGFVDRKMHEIANTTRVVDTARVAVTACLNIAEELFEEKKQRPDPRREREETEKINRLTRILDKVL